MRGLACVVNPIGISNRNGSKAKSDMHLWCEYLNNLKVFMKKILSIPILSITSVVGADLSHQTEILPMEDLLLDRTYSIYVPRIRPPEVSIHEVVQKIIDQQLPLIELFDEELES